LSGTSQERKKRGGSTFSKEGVSAYPSEKKGMKGETTERGLRLSASPQGKKDGLTQEKRNMREMILRSTLTLKKHVNTTSEEKMLEEGGTNSGGKKKKKALGKEYSSDPILEELQLGVLKRGGSSSELIVL